MKIGYAGILLGAAALLLVLIRFWVGPFTTVSSIDISGGQKVALIHDIAAVLDLDVLVRLMIKILGGLALILAAVACVKKEPYVFPSGAAVLGGSAIAFQFIAMYAMALLAVLVICVVLSSLINGLPF